MCIDGCLLFGLGKQLASGKIVFYSVQIHWDSAWTSVKPRIKKIIFKQN